MKSRLYFLVKIYVFMVLTLVIAKPVFMLCNRADQTISGSDMLAVTVHGLPADLSTALYLILIPFLVAFLSVWAWHWNPLRQMLKFYYAIAAFVLSLAFVADTSLYKLWGCKLNAPALHHLTTPDGPLAGVSVWFILLRILLISLLTVLIYFILVWLTPQQKEHRRSIGFVSYSRRRTSSGNRFSISPIKNIGLRIIASVVFLLLTPLIVFGLKGWGSGSVGNAEQVSFSQNPFLNHSAVNPLCSFFTSFDKPLTIKKTKSLAEHFGKKEMDKQLDGIFDTRSVNPQQLLTTQRPNIVLVILEGCGSIFTEANNNGHVTPNLTKLSGEGVYFTSCFANGRRADLGTLSILSGCPQSEESLEEKNAQAHETSSSITRTLRDNGYSTAFIHGAFTDSTITRSCVENLGFEHFTTGNDLTDGKQHSDKQGVNDWIAFGNLYDKITKEQQPAGKPWFVALQTLSSQAPWAVPMKKKYDDEVLNAFYFTDICLGDFAKKLKASEAWDNTLLIIIPNRSIQYQDIDQTKRMRNRIPMIWTGGAVKKAARIGLACNQTDLAATLFGQMGIEHEAFTFSRDILSTNYTHQFAMNNWHEGFSTYDASGFNVYDLKQNKVIVGTDGSAIKTGKAIIQAVRTSTSAASQHRSSKSD